MKRRRRKPRRRGAGKVEPPESAKEALARLPDGKAWLDTRDIQAVFGVHEITVYTWVGEGKLKAFRSRARRNANLYKREDVIALIKTRFTPKRAS